MRPHPIKAVRDLTEEYYGDFENDHGTLKLTFSRESSTDCSIKHMLSGLYATGALEGDPVPMSHNALDELSHDYPMDIANNAFVKLGPNPDHVIVEIQAMGLVAE